MNKTKKTLMITLKNTVTLHKIIHIDANGKFKIISIEPKPDGQFVKRNLFLFFFPNDKLNKIINENKYAAHFVWEKKNHLNKIK